MREFLSLPFLSSRFFVQCLASRSKNLIFTLAVGLDEHLYRIAETREQVTHASFPKQRRRKLGVFCSRTLNDEIDRTSETPPEVWGGYYFCRIVRAKLLQSGY